MSEPKIVIDASTLSSLARADLINGTGLNTLLAGNAKIVITTQVLSEIQAPSEVSAIIQSWLNANATRLEFPTVDLSQSQFAGQTSNLGEKTVIEYVRSNPLPEGSVILVDDAFVRNFESNQLPQANRGILDGAVGRSQTSIDFLNQSLLNDRISPLEYTSIVEGMRNDPRVWNGWADSRDARPQFWTYEEAQARWADWRFFSGIDFGQLQADMAWVVNHTGIDDSTTLQTSFKLINVAGGVFLAIDAGATTLKIASYVSDGNIYGVGDEAIGFVGRLTGAMYGGTYGALALGGTCLTLTGGSGSFACGGLALLGLLGGAYYGATTGDAVARGLYDATWDALARLSGITPAEAATTAALPAIFQSGVISLNLTEGGDAADPWATSSMQIHSSIASGNSLIVANYVNGSSETTEINTSSDDDWFSRATLVDTTGSVVTTTTTLNSGAEVTRSRDPNSDPEDPASWQRTVKPAPGAGEIAGGQIGSLLGSSLGQLIGGDNPFARIAASTALGAVLQNVGEAFGQVLDTGTDLLNAVDNVLDDFPVDLGNAFRSAGIGALTSFLTTELAESLGVNSDSFGGALFTYVAGQGISENRLAGQPGIAAPAIVLQGMDDGVDPPGEVDAYASYFTGPYERRRIPRAGHNLPQEAPAAFA